MADAEADAAFLSSMQAADYEHTEGLNTIPGNDSVEQIESDEYDPDVQDSFLPDPQNQASSVVDSPIASRPTSTNPKPVSFPAPNSASDHANGDRPTTSTSVKSSTSAAFPTKGNTASTASANSPRSATSKPRLPNDTIGILEDRIKEDEKGDVDAWLGLINEHKKRGKLDDVRKVYERFFAVFPHAAEQWIALAQLESEANDRQRVEKIFQTTLKDIPHLQLWRLYLDHIRRYFNISVDKSNSASQTTHAAYDAVLDAVGIDKEAGALWQDFITFIKSGPGTLGQQDWQSQSKMDLLRKAYQDAVSVPTQSVEAIWKDYSNFENSLNKMTGRQLLQKKAPDYVSARSSYTELQNITRDLKRTTIPTLPPALGFEGDVEYIKQVEIWRRWIQWEKDDPLVLKAENPGAYRKRVLFVYKQALMALRFWPEMWYDAADFCYSINLDTEGDEFLTQGVLANPESSLLAFKRADRLEMTTTNGSDDDSKQQRGIKVRQPYDTLLDALYALIAKAMEREKNELNRIEAEFATSRTEATNGVVKFQDDEDEDEDEPKKEVQDEKQIKINAVKAVNAVQISILNRSISHAYIALMRAMQRIQGKGKPGSKIGGSRQAFIDARRRGRITSLVWEVAALMEYHNGDVEAAKRVFDKGSKVFSNDETIALSFIKFLTNIGDHTNARVVFETTVARLTQSPETTPKAKPLFAFFHQFESQYGELALVQKIERRIEELYPDDTKLSWFSQRFMSDNFDPTAIRPIISPLTQAKPKSMPGAEDRPPPSRQPSPPAVSIAPPPVASHSPKRPAPLDDFEADSNRPRKLPRGESPLAGAAGRRLNQMRHSRQPNESTPNNVQNGSFVPPPPPPPLPRDITFLLSIIPPASTYNTVPFKVDEMIKLIRDTPVPASVNQLPPSQLPASHAPIVPGPATTSQYGHGAPTYYPGQPMYR